jgi:hypothetical protein
MEAKPNPDPKSNGSLLDRFKNAKPEGGLPVYKFEKIGDAIAARFIKRRQGIKTQLGTGKVLDVEILECSDSETVGPHTIFESGHITRIFDAHNLASGTRFYLRLHEIDRKSKFKRFAFELIDDQQASAPSDEDIPDDVPF